MREIVIIKRNRGTRYNVRNDLLYELMGGFN